ncbi:hypothetical protein POM88_049503 [Heracleum sosnowskyi]|uniref:Uncharacterized protein n=1 Tax=Heracleum sosnowskyi TaxID=360622 RepID=A0AAD8GXV0_9APIA|nr:hypothetical protein POM88_049503 [Heracleum sosnowskyi]
MWRRVGMILVVWLSGFGRMFAGAGGALSHPPADAPTLDSSEQVYISSLALLKMLKHGRAGVPMEVMVGVFVIVNLIGLLVQSVFYYVCKSYHHEGVDKSALYDHLSGYLGEYMTLKSSIQMENLDV